MPLAPAIAAALNVGLTPRAKGLYIDGLDVVKMAGGAGVPPRSVSLTWAGPSQVSSLEFLLLDPLQALAPTAGQLVRFVNLTADLPLFLGWITDVRYDTLSIGRQFRIRCTGIEAVLDWMKVPSITFDGTQTLADMARALFVAATAVGVSLNMASLGTSGSTVATPIAGFYTNVTPFVPVTTPAGSLRRALEYTMNYEVAQLAQDVSTAQLLETQVTVDRWGGLRIYARRATGSSAGILNGGGFGDHAIMTVSTAGPVRPSNPSAGYSTSDTPRGVLVKGATAAATLTVSDGSGIAGRIDSITDPATTAAQALAAGLSYLSRQGQLLTGTFAIEGLQSGGIAGSLVDALSMVTYTDTVLGISASSTWITSLAITFAESGEETWQVAIGATLATGSAYLRTLTQDQLV